jgi:hypothetical protein
MEGTPLCEVVVCMAVQAHKTAGVPHLPTALGILAALLNSCFSF